MYYFRHKDMYKHPVAFLSVNNLTVARYAAAMMVDYVGFCLDNNREDTITVAKAKEIMGWLSGVKFIGEFYDRPADEITAIALELKLDLVLLYGEYSDEEIKSFPLPAISRSFKPFTTYIFHDEIITDKDGNIFAIPFYSEKEDETGVIDFGEITDKLNALEV
jgi:phosphoribosylanthranilate isomerase